MCAIHDARIRRDKGERQRGGFPRRKGRRLQSEQISIDRRILRKRALNATDAASHSVDFVGHFKGCDSRSDLFNDTGQIDSQYKWDRMVRMRGAARSDFHVKWIKAARGNAHQYLSRPRFRTRDIRKFERAIVAIENERLHLYHSLFV